MNDESSCCSERCKTTVVYFIGLGGSFLLVAGLAWMMNFYTQPLPVGQGKAKQRRDNLKAHQAENTEALNTLAKDPLKDVVRLPINTAMDLTVREWQKNSAAARTSLITRMEKATAKPPEKKSEFE